MDATAAPENISSSRKRRKRKDGDGSSVNSGHSTTEGRPHKSHGGGISKIFSVFLNCCRAPDSAHGVSDDESPRRSRKPQSVSGRKSTPVEPAGQKNSLKDSGIETASKDVVIDEKKGEQSTVVAPPAPVIVVAHAPVDTREHAKPSGKQVVEVSTDRSLLKDDIPLVTTQTSETKVHAEPPLVMAQREIEEIRPATSSPVPQLPAKEDVVMTDAEPEQPQVKPQVVPVPQPPVVVEEEAVVVRAEPKPVVEDAPLADDDTHDGEIVESPPAEQKQWLLPILKPEFQGKKCLVLDLDETLVHSSFKVHNYLALLS